MLKKLIGAAVVLGMLLFSIPAVAEPDKWMSGEPVVLGAYCNSTDEQLVRDMSAAIVQAGWGGYVKWISGPHPCFDFRLPSHYQLGVRRVQGILLEKLWTVETDDERIEIWRFMDRARQIGFTWLTPKPVPESEA